MRITLLAAGFVIGERCQLIATHVDCWVPVARVWSRTSRRLQQHRLSSGPISGQAFTSVFNPPGPPRSRPSSIISALKNPHGILTTEGKDGCCVRDMMKQSGADIKSWTDKAPTQAKDGTCRPTRTFVVEVGSRHGMAWPTCRGTCCIDFGSSKVGFLRLQPAHPGCIPSASWPWPAPTPACCQIGLAHGRAQRQFSTHCRVPDQWPLRTSGSDHSIPPRLTLCCAPSCRARRKMW